jgi:hypothetical protein
MKAQTKRQIEILVSGLTGFLLAFGSIWKLWKMATSGETK